MKNQFSRRSALKIVGVGAALMGAPAASRSASNSQSRSDDWDNTHDRVWLGESYWANPMEDWRVVNGAAECQSQGGDRNIRLITHQVTNAKGRLVMSVRLTRVQAAPQDPGAGFRIGIRSDINEYRSNAFARGGLDAGIIQGELALGPKRQAVAGLENPRDLQLRLTGEPAGGRYALKLTVLNAQGQALGSVDHRVASDAVLGNIALVNNYDANFRRARGGRYRFSDWAADGDAFTVTPEHRFGPILWSMYTLSDSRSDEGLVLKLSALTGPLGAQDNPAVELHAKRGGQWAKVGTEKLDPDAWTATFRISRWDAASPVPFKLVYRQSHRDGSETVHERAGTIRSNPSGRPLRLGALTCQKDYGFPYEPVANNVLKLDPDLVYFSGDQLYEDHGGYGLIRDPAGPAILNYLRKFYMFGWAFGEVVRDRPVVCIPDDHDVFQGNIWGEGGMQMTEGSTSSKGGYREPARMVNVVHRTCASHHPDSFDPTPCLQDISVYYGDLVYGGVSFAILGDRQFKSGPERVDTGSGRADHVMDPDFDTSVLDKPGLELLGERQEKFLEQWAKDWRGHTMKVLLSQTVFAGVATHHGKYDGYLKADLDSGGWPQAARNRTIRILRPARALHINGDQHLTTLIQYGAEAQRDGCWSFCTPAISAGYPRWWRPDELKMPHRNRPRHGLPHTGEYRDGLGNQVYVYAVGNPEVGKMKNRYELAHQKGSGFGFVTIDPQARTYRVESFRFLIDPTDGKAESQFPGWPVVIQQKENAGENIVG